jgi:AMMECR1 domain-containing protein
MQIIHFVLQVIIGVHGIIASKGWKYGTYLPQVAVEQGWDVYTFVTRCANEKAGIAGDVLSDPDVKWEIYTTTILKENKKRSKREPFNRSI